VRLCTFAFRDDPAQHPHPGVVEADTVTRLDAPDLVTVLASGRVDPTGGTRPLTDVHLLAPIPSPPSIRDFFAFEEHIATNRRRRGQEVPEFWYEEPVFYFTNPAAVIGPEQVVPYPCGTQMLDYELEVAAVIGADERIAGFTIMNDWSARDIQRRETSVGLGPAKAKDFATSLGPTLVTVDEFDGQNATMRAVVNGQELSRGELGSIFHSWDVILERAARNTRLRPGDVLGSGTVGTGCLLELDDQPYLRPGDVVELAVDGLGVLRNTVGPEPPGNRRVDS
jgi:fumarylacetoacetate (FAA) hydrolase